MQQRVLCFGELLVRLSGPGKELLLQSPALQLHVGGAEANVAVALSYLDHPAEFITAVPPNALARACLNELRKHKVSTDNVGFADGRLGLYFLTHGAGHRPSEVLYDRAYSTFATINPDAYDWSVLLRDVAWLHVSGITPAVSPTAAEAIRRGMAAAAKASIKISFDCNYRARLWGARTHEAPAILRDLCGFADLLFADERDIALMFGQGPMHGKELSADAAAATAFDTWPRLQWFANTLRSQENDVQTLSGVVRSRHATHASRRYVLRDIVDRIGSGDAYAAALIDQLLQGKQAGDQLQHAVEFATAAAVLKHSISGDFNLSSRHDIEAVVSGASSDVRR